MKLCSRVAAMVKIRPHQHRRVLMLLMLVVIGLLFVTSVGVQLAWKPAIAILPYYTSLFVPKFDNLDYDFVINVFAWQRVAPLKRLCESLSQANYGGYHVPLHFYVDGGATSAVLEYLEAFSWRYGDKVVVVREERIGLEANIATSCVTDSLPASEQRLCFFFEDDGDVSPHFFQWTLKQLAAGHNPHNSQLVGIALNGLRVDQYTTRRYFTDNAPAKEQLTFPPRSDRRFGTTGWSIYGAFLPHGSLGGTVFFLQQPSSWGSVYFSHHWERFQQFRQERKEQESQGIRMDLLHTRALHWENSWKRFMLDYMYLHGCYMLYPNYAWQRSLATTRREVGEHNDKALDDFTSWVFVTPLDMFGFNLMSQNPDVPSVFDFQLRSTTEEELLVIGCAAGRFLGSNLEVCQHTTPLAIENAVASRLAPTIPDLTLFTTLKLPTKLPVGRLPAPEKLAFTAIEELWPRVELLVFASRDDCDKIRGYHYVRCVNEDLCRHPTEGRPMVGCLFQAARDHPASGPIIGYSNSDIVHGKTLLPAIDAIKREHSKFMAVGRRTNVLCNSKTEELDLSTTEKHAPWAIDYFITPKTNPLIDEIPPFLIGSTRFDNWILMSAVKDPETVTVDVTEAHTVLHPYVGQTTLKSSADRDGTAYNALLAGPDYRLGRITYTNLIMDAGFRMRENFGYQAGMEALKNNSAEWAMQYEVEKLVSFRRYISVKESLYYLVAHLHPSIRKTTGTAIDKQRVQKLLGDLPSTNVAKHTVLLTPTAFFGERSWEFKELLAAMVGKDSMVVKHIPCVDNQEPDHCWIQRSADVGLLVADNSKEMVIQHPTIFDALAADSSLLLLTYLPFDKLLATRQTSAAFQRHTKRVEANPLRMLKHRGFGCIYALPPKHVDLTESWDSKTPNIKQEPQSHRFSITIDMLLDGVQAWSKTHPDGGVSLLCFPYRSLAESAVGVARG